MWLVNTSGSVSRDGATQSSSPHTVEGGKVPAVHAKNMLGKAVRVLPDSGKGKALLRTIFTQGALGG